MTHFGEIPESKQTLRQQEIAGHTEVMRGLLIASADHARKYLTLTNGGGAVALLAFMGNSAAVRAAASARLSLALFVFGLIAVGVLSAADHHMNRAGFLKWVQETGRFFHNEIDYEDLYAALNFASRHTGKASIVAGYFAFACFILGGVIGIGGFLLGGGP